MDTEETHTKHKYNVGDKVMILHCPCDNVERLGKNYSDYQGEIINYFWRDDDDLIYAVKIIDYKTKEVFKKPNGEEISGIELWHLLKDIVCPNCHNSGYVISTGQNTISKYSRGW